MTMSALLLSLAICIEHVSGDLPCTIGAYVDTPILHAKFLLFDKYISYRARFGDRAYLSEGLQCLEGGRDYKPGIQYAVLDGPNATQCSSSQPIFPASSPQQHDRCSPLAYETDPWACAPGDWSGKFGPMDLGLTPIVKNLYSANQRFLEERERSLQEVRQQSGNAPPQTLLAPKEEVAVHADRMPVPPCAYAGKTLGIFCADGRLAGCGELRIIARGSQKEMMEAAFAFFVPVPPPATGGENLITHPDEVERVGWRETISKEVSKMPDYVSGWWEDVKRKSSGAWSARKDILS